MKQKRTIILLIIVVIATLLLSSCGLFSGDQGDERRALQEAGKAKGDTQELLNLDKKRQVEENPNTIGYLYLTSYGQPVGYYVVRGKVSSNGSQRTPEQEIIYSCDGGNCSHSVVDGPQDDASYGEHDPGIFFFLADGSMKVTNYDYQYSTTPLPLPDFLKLGG